MDGQFQKAGFDPERVVECHGSIHHLQCINCCTDAIWRADDFFPDVDLDSCRLRNVLPVCRHCGSIARPNILMFNDGTWLSARSDAQDDRLRDWLGKAERVVVLELGAGVHIPSVRRFGESVQAPLVRINPRDNRICGTDQLAVKAGALEGLRLLQSIGAPVTEGGPAHLVTRMNEVTLTEIPLSEEIRVEVKWAFESFLAS